LNKPPPAKPPPLLPSPDAAPPSVDLLLSWLWIAADVFHGMFTMKLETNEQYAPRTHDMQSNNMP
jgi:hypothetical protein